MKQWLVNVRGEWIRPYRCSTYFMRIPNLTRIEYNKPIQADNPKFAFAMRPLPKTPASH
jgi:hypothetical protein